MCIIVSLLVHQSDLLIAGNLYNSITRQMSVGELSQTGGWQLLLLSLRSTTRDIAGQFEISCVQTNCPFIDLVPYDELLVVALTLSRM